MAGLVLTRKAKQSIMIEDVEVTIESIKGGTVKVRIKADQAVRILRKEVADRDEVPA